MKGAMLGAAFWHELPKMSGFVHVDRPTTRSCLQGVQITFSSLAGAHNQP